MDVTLKINDLDISGLLSTYQVTNEITYRRVITTLDDTEHPYPGNIRPIIQFSLFPLTEKQISDIFSALSPLVVDVTYTSPYVGIEQSAYMRVESNIDAVFGIKSIDGNRYYKGGTIQLRSL